eukprot:CAMPEP_0206427288 /NCGR_PEP_ID=MMETSP0324_2-20121206/4937_1 /ASSEMBLY_ACC=CAM_ASM_000836 /TAXON_ID=2866 /ORGANISM="Crypthecodinium cohnii, Strain Seligo" /LENGTH=212 /DNA_ID=CAMNT_0053892511 /DNA_START=652 /DNA_END=1291 /DNA_ORIENTATION=-
MKKTAKGPTNIIAREDFCPSLSPSALSAGPRNLAKDSSKALFNRSTTLLQEQGRGLRLHGGVHVAVHADHEIQDSDRENESDETNEAEDHVGVLTDALHFCECLGIACEYCVEEGLQYILHRVRPPDRGESGQEGTPNKACEQEKLGHREDGRGDCQDLVPQPRDQPKSVGKLEPPQEDVQAEQNGVYLPLLRKDLEEDDVGRERSRDKPFD